MGHRELRPVPLNWEHPQAGGTYGNGRPRYVPLFSRADLRGDVADLDEQINAAIRAGTFAETEFEPIFEQDYMPEIPEGTPLGWQLYETTSEGTPVSPVFATLEELAGWCETGATVFADERWTAAQWLASFKADSLAVMSLAYGTPGKGLTVGDPLADSD